MLAPHRPGVRAHPIEKRRERTRWTRGRERRDDDGTEKCQTYGEGHDVNFELLDRYLLEGTPPKAEVVKALLAQPTDLATAGPFYEGMRLLGARTPDLTLIALRLVLAGKKADDAHVVTLRGAVETARGGGPEADAARNIYRNALA